MKINSKILISLICSICFLLGAYLIGNSLKQFRVDDRVISVKGFAEQEVKSNFAIWTIKNRITSNELSIGSKTIENEKLKIIAFLKSNGINESEITQQRLNVIDKLAREYTNNENSGYRYIIENTLQVRSTNVDLIDKVSKLTDELLKIGVAIAEEQDYNPSVSFIYTGLNEIKPKMLSEAVLNAKKAAEQFTKDSDVELRQLKRGSQGLFTIVDREIANKSANQNGYESSTNDIYKKIRVVVSVEYSIQ